MLTTLSSYSSRKCWNLGFYTVRYCGSSRIYYPEPVENQLPHPELGIHPNVQIQFWKSTVLKSDFQLDKNYCHYLLNYLIRAILVEKKKDKKNIEMFEIHSQVSAKVVEMISLNNWWPNASGSVTFLFTYYRLNNFFQLGIKLYESLPEYVKISYDNILFLISGLARRNNFEVSAEIFNRSKSNCVNLEHNVIINFSKNCRDSNSVIQFIERLKIEYFTEEIFTAIFQALGRPGCGNIILSYWDKLNQQGKPSVSTYLVFLKSSELSHLQALDARKFWVKLKNNPEEDLQPIDQWIQSLSARTLYGTKDWDNDL